MLEYRIPPLLFLWYADHDHPPSTSGILVLPICSGRGVVVRLAAYLILEKMTKSTPQGFDVEERNDALSTVINRVAGAAGER